MNAGATKKAEDEKHAAAEAERLRDEAEAAAKKAEDEKNAAAAAERLRDEAEAAAKKAEDEGHKVGTVGLTAATVPFGETEISSSAAIQFASRANAGLVMPPGVQAPGIKLPPGTSLG